MLIYYAVMIAMDLQRLKAAKAAEAEKDNEEEIDISDEVQNFQPAQISREHPDGEPTKDKGKEEKEDKNEEVKEKKTENDNDNVNSDVQGQDKPTEKKTVDSPHETTEKKTEERSDENNEEQPDTSQKERSDEKPEEHPDEKPFRRAGYREAIMTDGIPVERLIEEVNKQMETGSSDLGAVVLSCEQAKFLWPIRSELTRQNDTWMTSVSCAMKYTTNHFQNANNQESSKETRRAYSLLKVRAAWRCRSHGTDDFRRRDDGGQ